MPGPTEKLDSWHTVDPAFMIARLKGGVRRAPAGHWPIHKNVSPLDLYAYLKTRFGSPNGFMMTLKNPSSDNLIHWHWSLQCDDQVIEFMGYNLYAMAVIDGTSDPTEGDLEAFVMNIKADFTRHGQGTGAVRKLLEKWTIFTNPYHRLQRVVDDLSKRLRSLDIENIPLPDLPTSSAELEQQSAQWAACQAAYTEALGFGLTLRMIAPVLAESFVNVVIFLLAKPELRKDDRLYKNTIRQEIDIRVKSLHLTCQGFASPVDSSASAFKDFHTLMNGRNDFLHGNIDPLQLKYDVVHFDGMIPLFDRYKNISELALVNSLVHVEPRLALGDVEIVAAFIKLVLNHLRPEVKQTVKMFMRTPDPGWRDDKKRAGILFPPRIVHSVPGPRQQDAHGGES